MKIIILTLMIFTFAIGYLVSLLSELFKMKKDLYNIKRKIDRIGSGREWT